MHCLSKLFVRIVQTPFVYGLSVRIAYADCLCGLSVLIVRPVLIVCKDYGIICTDYFSRL